MHVDRSRFLLLTAALATAACAREASESKPDEVEAKAGKTDEAQKSGDAKAPPVDASKTSAPSTAATSSAPRGKSLAPAPTDESGLPPPVAENLD
jgi:hypothetical protein